MIFYFIKIPLPGQKKSSSDAQYGQHSQYGSQFGSESAPNGRIPGGYQSGYNNNKGYTSGNERKPIKYDSK